MGDSGADSNTGKVPTESEGIEPNETESLLSSEKRVDGSLKESSTRDKENEYIYKSPTIEGFKHRRNGDLLVKIGGGKMYALPFSFATKPQTIYSEGFYCIMHDNVWYRFQQYSLESPHLQNTQTKNCIKLTEYSKSMHDTVKKNKKHTKSRHSSQESLDSQTIAVTSSMAMEAITNSSVDTAQSAEGGIVTETDKLAAKRTEINRGETCETDNEEKPIDETEEKSRTDATVSSGGNAVKGFEAEIYTNIDQTLTGDPVQKFKGELSRGHTDNISGDSDNTKEDESQAGRNTGKKPKKETLVKTFCEIDGIDRVEIFGGAEGTSEGNVSNISSSPAAATETISGNEPVLKLVIKYRKKQGKKYKNYFLKHMVSCSIYFRQILNFYTQTGCGKHMLDAITEKHHCKVSSVDDHLKDFIFDLSNVHNKSDVKHFVDEVLHNIEICAEESLSIDTVGIDPKIQDEVRERIKDGQELNGVWVEFFGDDNPVTVYTVCSKDQQQLVMQKITEVIRDAKKSLNSHKDMVTADFMWQMVMARFEYLQEIGLKFPSTEIIQDKKLNAFLLKGPQDEIKAVAGHLEELLKMAHNAVHEEVFSPGYQFEIFASSEMCDYIDKSLPKLPVVWIPNHQTKEIHLFSRDPELLKGMDKSIKGCIEEKLYSLLNKNSTLPSEKICLLEELKKKHKGRIVISLLESPTGLLVTTACDIFGGVDAEVQKILSSKRGIMHPKSCVSETPNGRDGKPNCKSEFGATNSDVENKNLPSEISDSGMVIEEEATTIPPPRTKRFKSSATKNAGIHEGVENANPEDPGLEQRVWSYPNGKKIKLVKATTCDADVIIIPGNSDKDDQSQFGNNKLVKLKVPDGTEGKAKMDLQEEVKQVLKQILEKIVGICIQPMEGWNFLLYLKCFLYGIYTCFMRNEGKPCPLECVILLVEDTTDFNKAVKIIQKSFKLEQDKSEVFAGQRLLQEQGSIFKRIKVKVEKGQLHEAQAEVLVNTVDRSLDLAKGVISSSLLDKAGKVIQKELQQYQGKAGFGEVLKTGAGTLPKPCKAIFHGVLYVYEEHSDCVKVFQDFLARCLEDANKKYRSIAFPPIGTGKLRYPKDLVASIMFQSVANFEKAHPESKLEEVIFVIYEKDQETLKVFEDLYRRCFETPVTDQKTVPAVSGVSKVLKYGQVEVQAKLGTFEKESHDCLLVFWETQCLFNISDKNHILHSAGSTVTQKWREHRNSRHFHQDAVLVTPGGDLRYTEIIHVACDINTINNAAKAGLMKADREKMKTVVVPVTHDDSFQRDAKKFCIEIIKAIKELSKKLKFVKSVSLVIQGLHNFPSFNEIFEQQSRMHGSEGKKDDVFEEVKEMHVTGAQGVSPSTSKNVRPKATVKMVKDPSSSVDRSVPSSHKKPEVKEPASPVITDVDRSGGDIEPLKAILPEKERHKSPEVQYSSEEQFCILVCDVKQEDARNLDDNIKTFGMAVKFVYPCKNGETLVICRNSKDKKNLLEKLKQQYKVKSVSPQKIQGLTAAVDPQIRTTVSKVLKKQDTVEQKSEINISHTESSNLFEAVTSQQPETFLKETQEINIHERSTENSISRNIENNKQIENVSETDFLAIQSLEVYSEWTQKFNIKFTYEKETLHLRGAHFDLSEEKKKEIEKEIVALRGKQKIEISYDPQAITQFKSAVNEAKSDELLLVWDDNNKQVLVYSDNYDDMQKFKHRVEFKMGKKKLTGRSGRRFAEQVDTKPLLSEEESPTKKKIARSFSWSQDVTNVEIFKTLEGIMVKVYKANILRLDVDCIVNAANENLQHGGGVALVIAKAAGHEIDREGSEVLKIRGRIKVGEQCVTTAGNLPYDSIIHTVGPRWSDYYPHDARNTARCERDLFYSIIGCFIEAEKRHLKSIALPAISSGIFAVPRDVCTEQYAKAVIHYSKTRTSLVLQEIHFIDMVPSIVNDMQLAFKRHLSCDGNAKHKVNNGDQTTAMDDLAGRDSDNNHGKIPDKNVCENLPNNDEQTEEKQNPAAQLWPVIEQKYFKKEKFLIYKPNNKVEVNVYMADITKLPGMQVITCSDDRSGNGHGAIASTLLKTGKSKYESIKKKAFQKNVVQFGDVIITEGGDSNVQLVVHAVLPSFKDTISSQKHNEMVSKCYDRILDEINKLQKTSLALPLLGAVCGELGYEGSVKLFLDSLEVFCNRTTTFNLKDIHIVDKDENITQRIANEFIKHTDRVRNHLLATHGRELKPTIDPSSHTSSVRPQEEISQVRPKNPMPGEKSKEDCSICLVEMKSAKTLSCGHIFCIKCVEKQLRTKQGCPKCRTVHGTIYGDQPEGGKMSIFTQKQSLAGFGKTGTLIIEYQIPAGTQGPNHPKPGKRYSGIFRTAYLPNTREGRKVCDLLKVAFDRRLIFTIGRYSWDEDTLVWNDIDHKTKLSGMYGYPDPDYLKKVQEQLAAKGITVTDLVQETQL